MARIARTEDKNPLPRHKASDPLRKQCYLCGSTNSLTTEHIFSKSTFKPNDIEHPVILTACSKCNKAKEYDEEYAIKHFLLTTETPEAEIPRKKYFNDIKKRRPPIILPPNQNKVSGMGLFNQMVRSMTDINLYSPNGILIGVGGQIPINSKRITNFYVNIGKGLYTSAANRIIDWSKYEIKSQFDSLTYQRFLTTEGYMFPINHAQFYEGWDAHLIFAGFVFKKSDGKEASMWSLALYNDQLATLAFIEQ